jgi:hypothetical protein
MAAHDGMTILKDVILDATSRIGHAISPLRPDRAGRRGGDGGSSVN